MVRHDCPECERPRVATIKDDDVVCATCGVDVNAGNVTTADADLTPREWDALGKKGKHPSAKSKSEGAGK